jgi:hypothetical protein
MQNITYNFHSDNSPEQNLHSSSHINSHTILPSNLKNPLKSIPFLQGYDFEENTLITFLLDASYNLITLNISQSTIANVNNITKFCITNTAKQIILATKTINASNHPNLTDLPYHFINELHSKLNPLAISLLDYIFFSQEDFFSLRYHDLLNIPNYDVTAAES